MTVDMTVAPVSKADTSLRVSAAGRFVGKKNFGLFISIAAAVQAQRPDIGFTLAGDGPEGASLKNMAAQTGAKIDFTGWTDMDALTSQTDIFILPSTDEPFGYVLAEMMDAGTAILSTPTSGADYMLDGGEIAPLIEADDVDKWVETILGLADDPDALAGLRNQIFSHIRKPHFPDRNLPSASPACWIASLHASNWQATILCATGQWQGGRVFDFFHCKR